MIVADGIYHVFARGNNKEDIFIDNVDRHAYLRLLAAALRSTGARLLAFILMSNHVHLVLHTPQPNIDEAIHGVHRPYAIRFNRRHGRIGHTFNNRYQSRLIVEDAYLLEATSYIHLNPVEAGLVAHPLEYPWSSYRHYVEPSRPHQLVDPAPVLSLLVNDPARSRGAYEEFVMAELHRKKR